MKRCPLRLALLLILSTIGSANAQRTTTEITSVAFTPDGKGVLATCLDGSLRIHDSEGKEVTRFTAHQGGALGVAVSPDGKQAATAGIDQSVRLWDLATRKEVRELKGHTKHSSAVAFSPDGKRLASGGHDGTVRLWDLAKGEEIRKLQVTDGRVTSLAFSLDGKLLATAGTRVTPVAGLALANGDQGRLWEVETGKQIAALPGQGTNIALTGDGTVVAIGGYGLEVGARGQGGVAIINQVAISPRIRILVYDRAAGREVLKLEDAGGAVALSPDGRFLVSGHGSMSHIQGHGGVSIFGAPAPKRAVTLWETQTGLAIRTLPLMNTNFSVLAVSPDGARLAAGDPQGRIHMADLTPEDWDEAKARQAGPKELETAWENLASKDPALAYRALWSLTAAGDQGVKALAERLKPVKVDTPAIRKLVANLDARLFAVRETAYKELQRMGYDAEPELRKVAKENLSLEAKKKIDDLLAALDSQSLIPEATRSLRAVVVLERIRTPEARALLERLTTGEPEARLTREAKLALERRK